MTRHWPLLVALAAAVVAGLLLLGSRQQPSAEVLLSGEHPAPASPPAPGLAGPGAQLSSLPAKPVERPSAPGPRGAVDVRTLPRGPLTVNVVGEDDQPLAPDTLHVDIGPGSGAPEWLSPPVLLADAETKSWHADAVPAGPVEVRVSGDHVRETSVTVEVTTAGGEPLKIKVARAGAIRYAVTLADGQVPAEVTLTLLDAQERPVPARFQTQSATALGSPRTGVKLKQGAEGVVMGVKPGRYVLRATSPAEETTDAKVDVVAGETVTLAITIRG